MDLDNWIAIGDAIKRHLIIKDYMALGYNRQTPNKCTSFSPAIFCPHKHLKDLSLLIFTSVLGSLITEEKVAKKTQILWPIQQCNASK